MFYKKSLGFIACVIFIACAIFVVNEKSESNKKDAFLDNINREIIQSNILIIRVDETENKVSFYKGSGVIFKEENGRYFALTANHVVENADETLKSSIYIILSDEDDENPLFKRVEYYSSFRKGNIEFSRSEYELAIIGFESDKSIPVVEISDDEPKYGDFVAAIGNPLTGLRNTITIGKIVSKEKELPGNYSEVSRKVTKKVFLHDAEIKSGNSGGMLINAKNELVGINLFSEYNFFNNFTKAGAMPVSEIVNFLELFDLETEN